MEKQSKVNQTVHVRKKTASSVSEENWKTPRRKKKAIYKVTTLDTSDMERIKRACKKILCP
jgi:hypothetical protein